jgi:hypothetical protein
MHLEKYTIQDLEKFIEEFQRKIIIQTEHLKDENLSETESKSIKEQLLTLKNLMAEYQRFLRRKYSEEKKEVNKG